MHIYNPFNLSIASDLASDVIDNLYCRVFVEIMLVCWVDYKTIKIPVKIVTSNAFSDNGVIPLRHLR